MARDEERGGAGAGPVADSARTSVPKREFFRGDRLITAEKGRAAGQATPPAKKAKFEVPSPQRVEAAALRLGAAHHAAATKRARSTVWAKFEAMASEFGWDTSAPASAEVLRKAAAVFHETTPQSAPTYFATLKGLLEDIEVFPPQLQRECTNLHKALSKSTRPAEQEAPLTFSLLLKLAKVAGEGDVVPLRILVLSWFCLLRGGEVTTIERSQTAAGSCVYKIPRSKTDQLGKGASVSFTCMCDSAPAKQWAQECRIPVAFCPVCVADERSRPEAKSASAASTNRRFQRLLEAAGVAREEEGRSRLCCGTHPARIGGARAAGLSLSKERLEALGRWKAGSAVVAHCVTRSSLCPAEEVGFAWPLTAVKMI